MSGIKQIFNKEMARIFKDKKMVFSVFLLPVLIMVVILSIVNGLASNMKDDIESHVAQVYIVNEPEALNDILDASKAKFKLKSIDGAKEMKQAKKEILDGEADLIVEFPDNFQQEIENYQEGSQIPQVKTYQNPSEDYSRTAADNMDAALEAYRQFLLSQRVSDMEQLTVFQINSDNDEMYIQDEKKASGKAIGTMLPYFITILLFAGAMGIGTDMIAGEKERGTLASLLVSPVKRSSIVLGKVFALMIISGATSVVYVAAMVAFMPQMMGGLSGKELGIDLSLRPEQIAMLAILLIAIAFLYSAVIVLVSVFAKTIKEANSYMMPVYMVILLLGITTMFTTGSPKEWFYVIPIYNTSLTLQGILTQEVTMAQYGMTLGVTLLTGGILIAAIAKAFESEKVMAV